MHPSAWANTAPLTSGDVPMLLLPWSFVLSGLVTGRHKPGSMPAVRVAVVSQDEKGAAVLSLMDEHLDEVKEPMPGRVAMQELRLFGAEAVQPGDVLVGYGIPANGRLDVCWHPFGRQSLIEACQRLLMALRAPDAYGVLPVGFKSPPAEVEAAVGTTRTQFKIAAARLFREGAIEPLRAHEMRQAALNGTHTGDQ